MIKKKSGNIAASGLRILKQITNKSVCNIRRPFDRN